MKYIITFIFLLITDIVFTQNVQNNNISEVYKYKSYNGFNAPISLTLNALPTGAVAGAFSKNPILPGDTTYVKIALQGIAAGAKSFKINSQSDTIAHLSILPFTIAPKITTASALIAPAAFQVNVIPSTVFSWNTITGAKSYQLQVALDTTFNNITIDTVQIGSMASTFASKDLPQYKKLFWRKFCQKSRSQKNSVLV